MSPGPRDHAPRIQAGRFKGRRLRVPGRGLTRPARARLRRSLFDMLQAEVPDSRWLDLYAGSGSLGIEALSRGACHVTFVESARPGRVVLHKNLEELSLQAPEVAVLPMRVPALFHRPAPEGGPFDLVSLDPPFAVSREDASLSELVDGLGAACAHGWFAPGALVAWEEPHPSPAPVPPHFECIDSRRFGSSRLRLFRVEGT